MTRGPSPNAASHIFDDLFEGEGDSGRRNAMIERERGGWVPNSGHESGGGESGWGNHGRSGESEGGVSHLVSLGSGEGVLGD
jgi:hypothetical protein